MAPKLLDIVVPDLCCARRLSKDLQRGKVAGDTWVCPKCSVEWRAELKEEDGTPYRKWAPYCPVVVFKT